MQGTAPTTHEVSHRHDNGFSVWKRHSTPNTTLDWVIIGVFNSAKEAYEYLGTISPTARFIRHDKA